MTISRMTYTQIILPRRRLNLSPFRVFGGLLVSIGLASFALLSLQYVSLDRSNKSLEGKIAALSGTKPVSALSTPEQRDNIRGSLVPVDQAEVAELIEKVRSLALVPLDEAPTLATVVDATKISDQPFFRNALVGDKLFVYSGAHTAVIYRPSEGKIVNMAFLVDDSSRTTQTSGGSSLPQVQGASKQASAEASLTHTLAVYYATDSAELRSKVGKALLAIPDIEVVQEALTRDANYAGVSVIDITGGQGSIVERLIQSLRGKKGTLPESEDKPNADILIIVGE